MAQDNIDTRTPEQMFQQAYDRIISIAKAIVKAKGWKYDYVIHKYYGCDLFHKPFRYIGSSMQGGIVMHNFFDDEMRAMNTTEFGEPLKMVP